MERSDHCHADDYSRYHDCPADDACAMHYDAAISVEAVRLAAVAAGRGLGPRIPDLEAYGGTIALGIDNVAEEMVEVMPTALSMARVRRQDGRHPTPEQALRWATRHGYRPLGMGDGGWLAPGNKADLLMIDVRRAHLVPLLRLTAPFSRHRSPIPTRSHRTIHRRPGRARRRRPPLRSRVGSAAPAR